MKKQRAEGFITFAHVGEDGHLKAHGIVIEPETEDGRSLQERVKKLVC